MRSTREWIGESPDTKIPDRVRIRVGDRDQWVCQCGCGRFIRPTDKWQTDHRKALINGGENRESNLRTLLMQCHQAKTAIDLAEKSRVYQIKKRHRGLRKASSFACARSSKWKKKINGQVVKR